MNRKAFFYFNSCKSTPLSIKTSDHRISYSLWNQRQWVATPHNPSEWSVCKVLKMYTFLPTSVSKNTWLVSNCWNHYNQLLEENKEGWQWVKDCLTHSSSPVGTAHMQWHVAETRKPSPIYKIIIEVPSFFFLNSILIHILDSNCYIFKSRAGFLNLSTVDIWGWIILCRVGWPTHYKMFSSIPGFYILDTRSTL